MAVGFELNDTVGFGLTVIVELAVPKQCVDELSVMVTVYVKEPVDDGVNVIEGVTAQLLHRYV